MKQSFSILTLLLLTLACGHPNKTGNPVKKTTVVDSPFIVNSELVTLGSDSLYMSISNYQNTENTEYRFNEKYQLCKLKNDTIFITNYQRGWYSGYGFKIFITKKGYSSCLFFFSDCGENRELKPLNQKLILNKDEFNVNDTLIAEFDLLESVNCKKSKTDIAIDTIEVKGKFKCRVRDSQYNWNTLMQERNFADFIKIANGTPDNIKNINLYNCGIHTIPKELVLFKNAESLTLDDNDLSKTDLSVLCKLNKLKLISFQRCNLSSFPACVLCFKDLEELYLHGNEIDSLPEQLYHLVKLKELGISSNKLTSISPSISNLTLLEMFEFDGNKIRRLPESMVNLKKLKTIYPTDSMDYIPKELIPNISMDMVYKGKWIQGRKM